MHRPTDTFTRSNFALKIDSEVINQVDPAKELLRPSPESLLNHMLWLMTEEGRRFRETAKVAGPAWLQSQEVSVEPSGADKQDLFRGYSWRGVAQSFIDLARRHAKIDSVGPRQDCAVESADIQLQREFASLDVDELHVELQQAKNRVALLEGELEARRSVAHTAHAKPSPIPSTEDDDISFFV